MLFTHLFKSPQDICPVCGQTPCNCTNITEGLKDPADNPCWKGYHPVGTKQKNGRTVPNCVPKESVEEGYLDNPGVEEDPVTNAITRRILLQRTDLLAKYGPEKVAAAIDEVADFVGDVDEIGSSDVSGWVRHVEQMLGNMEEGVVEDWQSVNKKDKTDGMSKKAVKAYRRENPGSKLKTAVTKKPSELKAGSKDAKRRKSFCARMSGNKGPMKDEKGRPTPKAKALKRWNCNEGVAEGSDDEAAYWDQVARINKTGKYAAQSTPTTFVSTEKALEVGDKVKYFGDVAYITDLGKNMATIDIPSKFGGASKTVRISDLRRVYKASDLSEQGVAEGDYDIRKDPTYQKYDPETHTMMYKDGKHKAVKHDQVAKAKSLGWKVRSSLKAFAKGQGGVAEGYTIYENADVLAGLTDILKIAASRQAPQNPRYFAQQVKDVALQLKDNPATQKWSNYLDDVVRWADVIASGKEQYSPQFAGEVHSVLGPATRAYQDALLNKPGVAEGEADSDGYSVDHADVGEYDYEGDQAKDQLNTIVRAARRLNNMLDDNENMPEWVQMKITTAADYIDTAADYIESNQEPDLDEGEKVGHMDADRFDAAVERLKQLAGAGPMKTVWDPAKRVYRNVPVAQQPGDKK